MGHCRHKKPQRRYLWLTSPSGAVLMLIPSRTASEAVLVGSCWCVWLSPSEMNGASKSLILAQANCYSHVLWRRKAVASAFCARNKRMALPRHLCWITKKPFGSAAACLQDESLLSALSAWSAIWKHLAHKRGLQFMWWPCGDLNILLTKYSANVLTKKKKKKKKKNECASDWLFCQSGACS